MTLVTANTLSDVNHFGGRFLAPSLAQKIAVAMDSKARTPYIAAVAAYLLGASVTEIVPAAFAIAAGLIAFLAVAAFTQVQEEVPVAPVSPLAAQLAALQAKNDALSAALAVVQKRLSSSIAERETLAVELTIDPLTGLQNRRGLDAAFAECGTDTVMALLDIDHFKKINDTFGHDAGDRVLRDFAARLRTALNDSLPIYRIGGEEFVVLFPQAEMATVAAMLADFRADLKTSNVLRSNDAMTVSFSAGLALHDNAEQTFDTVFKQADERLYTAKLTGRAKTVFSDDVNSNVIAFAA
ncbi:GGDEF domain-containing protein [Pseudorhodobacter wandonensis]|jgi:diguanylate cyclase (GGDEF)-like protein|uniref:GGDEF domain-containing protein n=1 Tax=Pseudorhodobacter wandonensis TaxID=1120568 RepID=UPI0009E27B79|nr:GGDEF domain-containing protein [Pseudorhodobacter wandonensis]